ncbi:MAG: phage head closure protein [Desulfitobacteriaceae bacterium]
MGSFVQIVNIEDLRYRITLQKKTITTDANGIEIVTWADYKTVWASYEPVGGREYFAAAAINSEDNVTFHVRYQKDITPDLQIVFGGQIYQILNVNDTAGRHIELQLISKVIVRG